MLNVPSLFNTKRVALLILLATLLASIYMLTYSGRIESSDTLGLFDATSSLIQYGDAYLDSSAWYSYPQPSVRGQYPLVWINVEPMQPILAAPLYWLAYHLPDVGMVHAVWVFNVLICALVGVVFFLFAIALGYSDLTALVGALLLGMCTIIWPYSKTFFREPLALLLILLAGLWLERWRSGGYRSIILLSGSVLSLIAGYLTKEAVIFAVPSLFLIAMPDFRVSNRWRRLFRWLVIAGLVGVGGFGLITSLGGGWDWQPLYMQIASMIGRRFFEIEWIHQALHSYLFSVGGSIWGTSPILLLAIPGLWLLYRGQSLRYFSAIVVMILCFALGYALLRGASWFGGLAWPPRFLVPAVPFVALAFLPVIERILRRPIHIPFLIGLVVLAVFSIWVQLSGLLLPWETYTQILPPEADGLGEWGGGLNVVRYLRWVMLPPLWTQRPLDLIWVRMDVPLWPLMFGAAALASGYGVYCLARKSDSRLRALLVWSVAAPLIFFIMAWLGLRAIYRDPYYLGDRQALHDFLPTAASVGQPGDVMFLDGTQYSPFFMNYGKFEYPRIITLSNQPGERPSPEQPPGVESDNPVDLLLPITPPLIYNVAGTRDHVWLLVDSSVWLPWRVRPLERFMASHYYPVQEISTDPPHPEIRLLEYDTTKAPDPFSFRGAEILTDLVYGDNIHLAGFTLPRGTSYTAGDTLPLSLYWTADTSIQQNYTVAWFVVKTDDSRIVQGTDTQPYWGFAPMTTWKPGVPVWDNRALRLPADLTPGEYQLWVRLYQSDAPDVILSVTGTQLRDENIGVLPIHIDIMP